MNWYLNVLKNYATFIGRARRKEYWMFLLFNTIITFLLGIVDGILGFGSNETGAGVLSSLYGLAVFIPALAVMVRRLHDIGRSGWWVIISLVPVIGFLVLLVFSCLDSQAGENQYGVNPKTLS